MRVRALMLAVALAACGQSGEKAAPAPHAIEPFDLNIEIGRYGVMLDQTENLTADRPGAGEAEPTEPAALARSLREVVWQYNLSRSKLCARGLFTDVACGPTYEPVWISEPADAAPSLEEIQTRSQAVGEEVMRFWNAVCEDARTRVTDPQERTYVCAIE